ncbi:cytochrome P450 [Altererythrobacter lutimaris]|uniref:Cytochrome P450 n=1 Tax=Altererythrobacter lutimaris TaxID=2743979 RepID=A0A850HDW0_9SPHN|nr:cytochrome P450 [Altererythrobacter lutimaris]NVE96029.1 cytochrome P450 [Altererythrobacter lutimaris]
MSAMDLLDIGVFEASGEHALFKDLRVQKGLWFNPEPDGPGFWSLVRYDDVLAAARDTKTFLSGHGTQIKDRKLEGHGAPSVHNSDGTLHARLRAIVMPGLSRSAVEAKAELITQTAQALIASAPKGEAFDYVEPLAVRLPMLVIAAILGVPENEAPQLVDLANTMSDVNADDALQADARAGLIEYFHHLAAAKREAPAEDVATLLVQADWPDPDRAKQLLDAYLMLLTVAGNETTRFLVSGGLAQLVRQGDYAAMRDNPSGIPAIVEEMCRFVSPVTHMRRTVSEDTEIAGQAIRKGEKVVLWFASANRDESKFTEPDRLVLDRSPNPHLGFGIGPHFCLGAHLARFESKVFFEAMAREIREIELIEEPKRLPSNWFTGWTKMMVRWQ